jgi:hypothetical protein
MCGVILYYGWAGERDCEKGIQCFSSCRMDPFSLMHVDLCAENRECVKQAKFLMSGEEKCKRIREKIGDVFMDGVKIPFSGKAAMGWYMMQLRRDEERGSDTRGLMEKVKRLNFEMQTVA